jgi:hypothetical protein
MVKCQLFKSSNILGRLHDKVQPFAGPLNSGAIELPTAASSSWLQLGYLNTEVHMPYGRK